MIPCTAQGQNRQFRRLQMGEKRKIEIAFRRFLKKPVYSSTAAEREWRDNNTLKSGILTLKRNTDTINTVRAPLCLFLESDRRARPPLQLLREANRSPLSARGVGDGRNWFTSRPAAELRSTLFEARSLACTLAARRLRANSSLRSGAGREE